MELIKMFDLFQNMLNLIKNMKKTVFATFENLFKCILALLGLKMALKNDFLT